LHESGLLAGLVSTIAIDRSRLRSPLGGWLDEIAARYLANRVVPEFLQGRVEAIWGRELVRVLASRAIGPRAAHKVWRWAEEGFDRTVARRYAGRYRCIYGMEHSSLETFRRQKAAGGLCVLRQVTAHGRTVAKILRTAAERHPSYITPYHAMLLAESDRIVARKCAEYELADLIIGNSEYVRGTFVAEGVAPDRVVCVSTGCPPVSGVPARAGRGTGRLRFLFVGTLSLRKGAPDLMAAWREFRPGAAAELWLAGAGELPESVWRNVPGVRYLGMLSRAQLMQTYRQADVFVLPTWCEGRAHAVLEALAAGLPLITTAASGCGDLVHDGLNGRLVAPGDAAALAQAMAACLEQREDLPEMGRHSRVHAAGWTVADANRAHVALIRDFLRERGY
jgi:glycosyltransferase involved in cell wall biosynthesis